MSKKTLKMITVLATIMVVICSCSLVFAGEGASSAAAASGAAALSAANSGEITPGGLNPKYDKDKMGSISDIGQKIMGIINTIGVVIAVVVLMILGIKYMMGSAEEKAEYKKTFIPYIIGAVLIFAATTIANVIYQFAQGLNK